MGLARAYSLHMQSEVPTQRNHAFLLTEPSTSDNLKLRYIIYKITVDL
jgi:hypothetical protein